MILRIHITHRPPLSRPSLVAPDSVLPYRNLDTLCSKALTQGRALDDPGELLSREDMEDVTETGG